MAEGTYPASSSLNNCVVIVVALVFTDMIMSVQSAPSAPGAIRCQRVSLKSLGVIKSRQNRTTTSYTCRNSSAMLFGSPSSECVNGSWSPPPPICVAAGCPNITVNFPLRSRFDRRYYGAVVTFRCSAGFELRGESQLTCDGQKWSSHIPYCSPAATVSDAPPTQSSAVHSVGVTDRMTVSGKSGTVSPTTSTGNVSYHFVEASSTTAENMEGCVECKKTTKSEETMVTGAIKFAAASSASSTIRNDGFHAATWPTTGEIAIPKSPSTTTSSVGVSAEQYTSIPSVLSPSSSAPSTAAVTNSATTLPAVKKPCIDKSACQPEPATLTTVETSRQYTTATTLVSSPSSSATLSTAVRLSSSSSMWNTTFPVWTDSEEFDAFLTTAMHVSTSGAAFDESASATAASGGVRSSTEAVIFDGSHSKSSTSWPRAPMTSFRVVVSEDEGVSSVTSYGTGQSIERLETTLSPLYVSEVTFISSMSSIHGSLGSTKQSVTNDDVTFKPMEPLETKTIKTRNESSLFSVAAFATVNEAVVNHVTTIDAKSLAISVSNSSDANTHSSSFVTSSQVSMSEIHSGKSARLQTSGDKLYTTAESDLLPSTGSETIEQKFRTRMIIPPSNHASAASSDAEWESSFPRQSDIEDTTRQYSTREVTDTYRDTVDLDVTLEDFEDFSTTNLDEIRTEIFRGTMHQDSKTHEDPEARESGTTSFSTASIRTTSSLSLHEHQTPPRTASSSSSSDHRDEDSRDSVERTSRTPNVERLTVHYQTKVFITQTSAALVDMLANDQQQEHPRDGEYSVKTGSGMMNLSDGAIFIIVMGILGFIATVVLMIIALLSCRHLTASTCLHRHHSAVATQPSIIEWMRIDDNVLKSTEAASAASQTFGVVNHSSEGITTRVVNGDQAKRRSDSLNALNDDDVFHQPLVFTSSEHRRLIHCSNHVFCSCISREQDSEPSSSSDGFAKPYAALDIQEDDATNKWETQM